MTLVDSGGVTSLSALTTGVTLKVPGTGSITGTVNLGGACQDPGYTGSVTLSFDPAAFGGTLKGVNGTSTTARVTRSCDGTTYTASFSLRNAPVKIATVLGAGISVQGAAIVFQRSTSGKTIWDFPNLFSERAADASNATNTTIRAVNGTAASVNTSSTSRSRSASATVTPTIPSASRQPLNARNMTALNADNNATKLNATKEQDELATYR